MKPSLNKLFKFFRLEIDHSFDNRAVIGGLEKILPWWEADARTEGVPEGIIQAVGERLRTYAGLSPLERAEALADLWKRLQSDLGDSLPPLPIASPARNDLPAAGAASLPKPPPPRRLRPPQVDLPPQEVAPSLPSPKKAETSVALSAPVTVLSGIGPKHGATLARLGLHTLGDLLYYFPRRYDDYSQLKPINRLNYGDVVTVIGVLQSVTRRVLHRSKQMTEAVVSDGSGAMRLTFWNPYVAKRLRPGMQVVLSGKVEQYLGRLVMSNPEVEELESENLNTHRIVPVYPLTANITQRWLRRQMKEVVTYWSPRVEDYLPDEVRRAAQLVDLPTALMQAHFPSSFDQLKAARFRLAFDEIFLLQLGVLRQKRQWQDRSARIFQTPDAWLAAQTARLPYALTQAQSRALADLRADLALGRPMNRLLQGDVGSGKTVVAALGMAMVVRQGAQAAIMAPTSILAEQHYKNLTKLFQVGSAPAHPPDEFTLQPSEIRLLIGATPAAERSEILAGLADGSVKILVGTHALIEEPVVFADLQFVVVDEQHRFGVEQRASLRAKGQNPHLLVMTATPIPRSLALTVYGDLDLSVMDEMPPGRQPVETQVFFPRERERVYQLVRSQIAQGRQAFIIYPLVEETESSELAAVEEHNRLQMTVFPKLKLGLLHGRMKPEEKDRVMADFRDGKTHILVSTSVVEVGVDVPNATVMVIEGANRFGLAQLHQFRGRVGRGGEKSFCILIPETADDAENERLQAMVATNDGFALAEKDLEQRGPGDFLGTRQAGFSELKMASLTDVHLIEMARRQAQTVFQQDPDLAQPQHELLLAALSRFWGDGQGDIS